MNIALLPSPSFEEIGGVSTHVYMLAKGLRELGHKVFVIPENAPDWIRVPFIRVPEIIISKGSLFFSRKYRRWAEDLYYVVNTLWKTKGSLDVLNVQNVQHVGMAKLLQRVTGCRLVLTVHGYLTYEAEARKWCAIGDKTHRWLWSMEKAGYDQFDSIICVGCRAGVYVEQFTNKFITIIHNGLDTDIYIPGSEGAAKSPTLLFAGLLQPAKGILDALQVVKILAKEYGIDVLLRIAGTGSQDSMARQYVKDNRLTHNVVFLGSLSKGRMPDFYRSGDVLLFPSKQAGLSGKSEESSPYAVLEAMSCGLPIIAYRTSALKEHVEDGVTGYLVELDNVGALANRVRELIENTKLLEKMGGAARTHCMRNFSHIQMAQQYLKVYGQETP